MTAVEMLSRLRTKLDEASASFWDDDECYRALTDGQNEILGVLPDEFTQNLVVNATLSGSQTGDEYVCDAPEDLYKIKEATLDDYPCRVLTNSAEIRKYAKNSYMQPSSTDPVLFWDKLTTSVTDFLVFKGSNSATSAKLWYIPKLPDINASTNSVLNPIAHPAIIQYAYSDLLKKMDRLSEALNEYGLFIQMIGVIR